MPPHKTNNGVAPYEDRFRMVELACRPYPRFEASRLEAEEGRSYTIDTVRRYRSQMAAGEQLFFLIGADAFDELESWKDWRELTQLIEFIVVTRPAETYDVPASARVHQLSGLQLPVSSSSIRTRLASGAPTPELPPAVREYIDCHGLYRQQKETTV
jgi:nicotinate-nucleotide adenylyltransferase